MRFSVLVEVSLRPGIADPQGSTIERSLPTLGFEGIEGVRVGKAIRFHMPADDEGRSFGGEAGRIAGGSKRPWVGNRYAVVFVQFARPTVVEQTESHVAMLLNFNQHDAGAYGVDSTGRDVDNVVFGNRPPLNEIRDRTVSYRCM